MDAAKAIHSWPWNKTYCTAVGKAAIAFLSDQMLDALIAGLAFRRYTPNTLTIPAELLRVRKRGFAVDNEEIEVGLRCVGAPIRNHTGRVTAAISIAGPIFRIKKRQVNAVAAAVVSAGSDLSRELG